MSDRIKTDQANVRILLDIIRHFQRIDSEFPLHYALCLAEISLDEGCSLTTLSERTGLTLSTVSRIVGALSDYRQNGHPYGLIEQRIAPAERRRKELYLTARGRNFTQKLGKLIESHAGTG